ncbi:hypothetical protein ACFWAP_00890 [Streptomyces goshikiensis]|uniref:hypothetical protein n=1 Tax=Streptomyces goshikiensis TaxID=1942 RepID=UPI003653F093
MAHELTSIVVLKQVQAGNRTVDMVFETTQVLITSAGQVADAVAEAIPHRPKCAGHRFTVKYHNGEVWVSLRAAGPARPERQWAVVR